MISKGRAKITKEGLLSKTTESEILYHYFGVKKVPCKICSPLREDENPSFSLFEKDGNIFYRDFSNGDKGDIFNLEITFSEVFGSGIEDEITVTIPKHDYFEPTGDSSKKLEKGDSYEFSIKYLGGTDKIPVSVTYKKDGSSNFHRRSKDGFHSSPCRELTS